MANIAEIMELYTAYFNRAADKDGVDYWANEMDTNGWTLDQVAQSFADQTEYTALYAGMTNAEIVTAVYTNVLNRDADEAGSAYWVAELDAGTMAVSNLIQAVVTAAKEDVDGLGDADIIANKTAVSQFAYDNGVNDTTTSLAAITADTASVTVATDAIQAAIDEAAAAAAADEEAIATVGSTIAFTDGIDALVGTANNDTFVGDAATLSSADQVAGGQGTDTAKLYNVAAQSDIPTLDSVENVYLIGATTSVDVSGTGATTIVADDLTTAKIVTIGADQDITLKNLAAGETQKVTTTATDTSVNLTLDAVGTSATAHTLVDVIGAKVDTLNVTATGTASYLTGLTASTATALTNVVIDGDVALSIGTALVAATTNIDASAMTAGGVTLIADKAVKTVTGSAGDDVITIADDSTATTLVVDMGAGDDTLNLDADGASGGTQIDMTSTTESFDGGEGDDTLVVDEDEIDELAISTAATTAPVVVNFETVKITGASVNFDMDNLTATGITNVNLVAGAGAQVDNMVSGSTLSLAGILTAGSTVTVKDASVAGHTSDVLNIALYDELDVDTFDLTVADVETINITSTVKSTVTNGDNEMSLIAVDTNTINVSGDEAVDFTAATAHASNFAALQTLNAADLDAELTVDISSANQGVVVTAGSKVLTITDSTNADVITGSAGDDVMTLTGGADSVTGNGGQDTFKFDDGDSTSTAYTTITDFGAGADGDIIDHVQDTLTYEDISAANAELIAADTTLAAAITQAFTQLAANEATAFEYDGSIYVVAEEATSGAGVYHAAEDLVIKVEGVASLDDFHADNFA